MVKISHKGLEWHSLILISTVLIQPFSLSCNLQHMLQCPLKLTRVLPDPPSQKWALQQMLKVFFKLELGWINPVLFPSVLLTYLGGHATSGVALLRSGPRLGSAQTSSWLGPGRWLVRLYFLEDFVQSSEPYKQQLATFSLPRRRVLTGKDPVSRVRRR